MWPSALLAAVAWLPAGTATLTPPTPPTVSVTVCAPYTLAALRSANRAVALAPAHGCVSTPALFPHPSSVCVVCTHSSALPGSTTSLFSTPLASYSKALCRL